MQQLMPGRSLRRLVAAATPARLAAMLVGGAALAAAPLAAQPLSVYQLDTLRPSSLDNSSGFFGRFVALDGDTAVVGVSSDIVYVFERNLGGADGWGLVEEVQPDDNGNFDDGFGRSALVGDLLAVGAPIHNHDGGPTTGTGAVYLFGRDAGGADSWGQVAELFGDDSIVLDRFGWAVALSADGDRLVVGAPFDNHSNRMDAGSVYVFERDAGGPGAWGQVAHLKAAVPIADELVGRAVAIDGDRVIAGGHDLGVSPGAAYIFERDLGGPGAWGQAARLVPGDGFGGRFGTSVGLVGDLAAVGATLDDEAATDAGAVYLFARDQGGPGAWGEVDKLIPDELAGGEQFGQLSMTASWLAVGAPLADTTRDEAGAVWIYAPPTLAEGSGWTEVAMVTPFGQGAEDHFGPTALSGDLLLAGAPEVNGNPGAGVAGQAYTFCLGCTTIFADGFEDGTTSRWGDAVP